ncbi:esterase/lipase family protein [Streptomyces sp. NPDC087844]|uniref:esterase/lipase family protein n=1 Tax=Streptomyces sp. NPDC087844 TaxID=3365805 RepID=UPI00380E0FD5
MNSENAATELSQTPERSAGNAQSAVHGVGAALDAAAASDDWGNAPDEQHPYPVVLVHGTLGSRETTWPQMTLKLKAAGYRVFSLNYGAMPTLPMLRGLYGLGDIKKSSQELADFVDRVLADTGAQQVDIVGHSQGGMTPHYYLKFLGGTGKVRRLVGIAPSCHGVTVDGLLALVRQLPAVREVVEAEVLFRVSPAFTQLLHDSDFVDELVAPGDTVNGVDYTVIWSTYDEVVKPPESQQLTPTHPDDQVTNLRLQTLDPKRRTRHLSMPSDSVVLRETLKALAD